jgi:putative oxidoreductase
MNQSRIASLRPYALSLLRIVAGFVYWLHGIQKVFGVLSPRPPLPPGTLVWYAGVIETVFGALIILGLFTVPAAFICSGEMAFAYFMAHFPRAVLPIKNGGETPVLCCFIFLYLFTAGAGSLSLDYLIGRIRNTRS